MKRGIFFVLFILCISAASLQAETIKMKNGSLISGSILSQTQYILNLATSYGNITLNQREIEQILPDKHRIVLKGGTQLIGVILDLDEFNLKLQTEEGTVVNVDMPQIVSIETYDYDRGENAQKEFVEKVQETQAKEQAAAQAQTQGVVQASGLTFDSDIDQVFDTKNATVVNGSVLTPTGRVEQMAPRPLTDKTQTAPSVHASVEETSYSPANKEELLAQNSKKKKKKELPKEADFSKYFSLQIGVRPTGLKLDNSTHGNYWTEQDNAIDVGGTGVAVSSKFLWRIKDSNLWAGPTLGLFSISNNSFADKDQTVVDDPTRYPDPTVKTSGRILSLGGALHYYLTPKSRFAFYLAATAGYESLKLNYRGELQSHSFSSNGFFAGAGLGVETWVDDLMLGMEVRDVYVKRSGKLAGSADSNLVLQLQTSWKF